MTKSKGNEQGTRQRIEVLWGRRCLMAVGFVVLGGCASCPATDRGAADVAVATPDLSVSGSDAVAVAAVAAEQALRGPLPTPGPDLPPRSAAEILALGPWLDTPELVAAVRHRRDGRPHLAFETLTEWLRANPGDVRAPAVRVWSDATALEMLERATVSADGKTFVDAKDVAASLERSAETMPELAPELRLDAVKALLFAGEAAEALARLEALAPWSDRELGAVADELARKARLALGHFAEVSEILQKQAKESPGTMTADAVDTLLKLDAKAVTKDVRVAFVSRFASDPRVIAVMEDWDLRELPLEVRIELAEKLLDAGRYQLTRQMLGVVGDGPHWKGPAACRAGLLHGFSLERTANRKNLKAQEKVFSFFSRLSQDCQGEVGAWATFIAGRNRVRLIGREKNAKKRQKLERDAHAMLTRHVREHAARSTVDDALAMLADLESDPVKADAQRLEALARHPDGDMAEALAWALVGGAVQRGDWPAVLARLDEVFTRVPEGPKSRHGGRFVYWRARAFAATGDAEGAAKLYRVIIREHAFSWYAVLALSQLCAADEACANRELAAVSEALGPIAGTPQDVATAPEPLAGAADKDGSANNAGAPKTIAPEKSMLATLWTNADFRRAVAWARIASHAHSDDSPFFDRVNHALNAVPKEVRPAGDAWFEARAAVLHLAGAWSKATGEARSLESRGGLAFPTADRIGLWQAAYPRPFFDEVQRFSDLRGIPAAWVWAIGRVESNFNPNAVSWANAIGLMQIIPPTAQSLARGTSIDPTPENLKKPEISIELATRYLAKLLGQHGQIPLASAGYNAGGGAVSRWRREFGELEVDRFVENIPYSEAHNYAKSVTQAAARYLWLYQQKPLLLQVKGPAADSVIPPAGADVDFAAPESATPSGDGTEAPVDADGAPGAMGEGASAHEP